jgi:hypothetical protein
MPADIEQRLARIEEKVDATYASAEKTRKYLLWMLVAAAATFVLPLIGLLFAIPSFIDTYSQMGGLLQ